MNAMWAAYSGCSCRGDSLRRIRCIRWPVRRCAKVPSELLPLLDAAIELTKFEIRMIHLRVVHPDIMNAPKDARCPKSPIYLAEGFTPKDLMELVAGM